MGKLFEILIERARATNSESVVITFDPHPQHVIGRGINPKKLLTRIGDKIEEITKLGIDHIFVIPFDIEFSKMTAEEFLKEIIIKRFNPIEIIVGSEFVTGSTRMKSGTAQKLVLNMILNIKLTILKV